MFFFSQIHAQNFKRRAFQIEKFNQEYEMTRGLCFEFQGCSVFNRLVYKFEFERRLQPKHGLKIVLFVFIEFKRKSILIESMSM